MASAKTQAILREVGGVAALHRFTSRFYDKSFLDPHLDQFIQSHEVEHVSIKFEKLDEDVRVGLGLLEVKMEPLLISNVAVDGLAGRAGLKIGDQLMVSHTASMPKP